MKSGGDNHEEGDKEFLKFLRRSFHSYIFFLSFTYLGRVLIVFRIDKKKKKTDNLFFMFFYCKRRF